MFEEENSKISPVVMMIKIIKCMQKTMYTKANYIKSQNV